MDPQVASSAEIDEATLELAAKSFEVRHTIAGVWDLTPATESAAPAPESTFVHKMINPSTESVVGTDERTLVAEEHFNPGGKYRSVVKLFTHYEFEPKGGYAMGTGWLIAPDLLVTAGHCSYDWGHNYGRATEVKAYVGYRGKDKVSDPNVEFRTVQKIVAPKVWLTSRGQKAHDVSFMKLNKPFTNVKPIKFEETPAQGNFEIGVVGYPGDLKDQATGERGAFMYEMFLQTNFNLAAQSDHMIEYQIDTFGGNSGSPVFVKSSLSSIGAHVYGGSVNSASVIGKYGNPYDDYIKAFNLPTSKKGLNFVEVPRLGVALPILGRGQLTKATRRRAPAKISSKALSGRRLYEADEEGFFRDVFQKAIKVGLPIAGKILGVAAPLVLGPIGAPIGALAGMALNAAGKLAETAEETGGLGPPELPSGPIERAILAEAVFKVVHEDGKLSAELQEGIFQDIKDTVIRAAPTIKKVAPHVLGAMMEPALRIALDALHKYNQKKAEGTESAEDDEAIEAFTPPIHSETIDRPLGDNTEGFISGLIGAIGTLFESSMEDEQEAFTDLFKAATRCGDKGVVGAAEYGLPLLVDAINSRNGGAAESGEAGDGDPTVAGLSQDALASRALVAEATLQAVMKISPSKLEEEGFFGDVWNQVKKWGPKVMQLAPTVVSAINPTVGGILGGVVGAFKKESAEAFVPTSSGFVGPQNSPFEMSILPHPNRFPYPYVPPGAPYPPWASAPPSFPHWPRPSPRPLPPSSGPINPRTLQGIHAAMGNSAVTVQ